MMLFVLIARRAGFEIRDRSTEMRMLQIGCVLLLVNLALPLAAQVPRPQEESKSETRSAEVEPLIPRWNLGDRWTVETINRPIQVRRGVNRAAMIQPIQWQFTVSRFEKSLTHDCFRLEVSCQLNDRPQPRTTLWIDRKSLALRQVTTEIPTPNGFRAMTISYDFASGQPAPVIGPMTALPIDMPIFLAGNAKGQQSFEYQAFHGPGGEKRLGDLSFAHQIDQKITELRREDVRHVFAGSFQKSLEQDAFTKSLAAKPVTEVQLKSPGHEIRQLWQSGQPWPIYCENGYTVCRLVSVSSTGDANR